MTSFDNFDRHYLPTMGHNPDNNSLLSSVYRHSNIIIQNEKGHRLWLGDLESASNIQDLKKHNIKTVITAVDGANLSYDSTIRHFVYPVQDHKSINLRQYFERTNQQVFNGLKMGSVLVHCAAGISRSSTIVIAYLIKHHKMTFHEALKLCKSRRPTVCPNLGFQLQLKDYEKSLRQPASMPLSRQQPIHGLTLSGHQQTFDDNNQSMFTQFSNNLPGITNHKPNALGNRPSNISMTQYNLRFRKQPKYKSESVAKQDKESGYQRNRTPNVKTEEYLRRVAEFRFGITNFKKWKVV